MSSPLHCNLPEHANYATSLASLELRLDAADSERRTMQGRLDAMQGRLDAADLERHTTQDRLGILEKAHYHLCVRSALETAEMLLLSKRTRRSIDMLSSSPLNIRNFHDATRIAAGTLKSAGITTQAILSAIAEADTLASAKSRSVIRHIAAVAAHPLAAAVQPVRVFSAPELLTFLSAYPSDKVTILQSQGSTKQVIATYADAYNVAQLYLHAMGLDPLPPLAPAGIAQNEARRLPHDTITSPLDSPLSAASSPGDQRPSHVEPRDAEAKSSSFASLGQPSASKKVVAATFAKVGGVTAANVTAPDMKTAHAMETQTHRGSQVSQTRPDCGSLTTVGTGTALALTDDAAAPVKAKSRAAKREGKRRSRVARNAITATLADVTQAEGPLRLDAATTPTQTVIRADTRRPTVDIDMEAVD